RKRPERTSGYGSVLCTKVLRPSSEGSPRSACHQQEGLIFHVNSLHQKRQQEPRSSHVETKPDAARTSAYATIRANQSAPKGLWRTHSCAPRRNSLLAYTYQTRRRASCALRARFAWLVMRPKSVMVGDRFGGLKDGWLRKLKNSHRNCRWMRPVIA